jgi:acetyl-CoA carboxylase biotin carboxyl carrier protein
MPTPKSPIDADAIRALADILTETNLSEIEVEQKGLRIRVARHLSVSANVAPGMASPVVTVASAPGAGAPASPAPSLPAKSGPKPGAVTSPMVGTVYRAPSPDKANFVEVGSQVRQGQTLLIIEAMKTFNEIPAPRAGTVTEILVESGHPVEYGEALVVIE